MRTIRVKKDNSSFLKDCQRIQHALIDKGYYATLDQCQELWEMHSAEYAAGWLVMNDINDEEIYYCIKKYFEEDAIVDG